MATLFVDLKLNHDLLDPHFDGYKLSLESLPVYTNNVDSGVETVALRDDQYTLQHVKAFGLHNHLISDPWNQNLLLHINTKWQLIKHSPGEGGPSLLSSEVYQLPDREQLKSRGDRLTPSIHCTSDNYLLVSDGAGYLYLLNTGDRSQDTPWKMCHKTKLPSSDDDDQPRPFLIKHSLLRSDTQGLHVECIVLSVDKTSETSNDTKSNYVTRLHWLTLFSASGEWWSDERVRVLEGASSPEYLAVNTDGSGLITAAQKPFSFVSDSVIPVEAEVEENGSDAETVSDTDKYVWMQTEEDVSIFFTLPPEISKPDIDFSLSAGGIQVAIKNTADLLQGPLYARVDVDSSTWTLTQEHGINKLEVHLEKTDPGVWTEVVVGDQRGHLVADLEQLEEISQRLMHLTSDKWSPDPEKDDKVYNAQELEDCDDYPSEVNTLSYLDGDKHSTVYSTTLTSHQWLFSVQSEAGKSPCFCLRHDVDGVVWQPTNDPESPWQHVGTFNALGYVQASKQQKKFSSCAPNFSYCVLCDCVRRVYLYRQPSSISTPLRNRKTYREVSAVAKQQLISLDSTENILGLHATNDRVFVLTDSTLFMIKVKSEV